MTMKLRDYQALAIQDTFTALKANDNPVLFVMSVGGGKSICIGSIVKTLSDKGKRSLCLVNSSELVRNNSKAYQSLGGAPSVFCASLNLKEYDQNVIFATPQSIISAIKNNHPIAEIAFNLIVVDEAHNINYTNHKTIFMRILRHYKGLHQPMRVLGLTGTQFRGIGTAIVGDNCLFKSKVANITTGWLIQNGYLVKPRFANHESESFDFSKARIMRTGEYNQKDLQDVLDKNTRLTGAILRECQKITANRNGSFIFCSTRKHCEEAMRSLPPDARMIIGTTPDGERNESLTLAREGKIKWLVSVNCLMVGVDCPLFDTIIWLRPTSSLVLFTQGIGRGLRLHDSKTDCLVLDFAGNLATHQDFDDPIINEAIQPREGDQDYCIECYTCNTMNSVHARRCIGVVHDKRCDYYFVWKDCTICGVQNDQTARQCRSCHAELIDPNKKLSLLTKTEVVQVLTAKYWLTAQGHYPIVHCAYQGMLHGKLQWFYEVFYTSTALKANIFYGKFLSAHLDDGKKWFTRRSNLHAIRKMIQEEPIKIPSYIHIRDLKIVKKIFKE